MSKPTVTQKVVKTFTDIRMLDWIVFAAFMFAGFWLIRVPSHVDYLKAIGVPADIPVFVGKLTGIALFGVAGMWFDRSAFPYGRPDRIVKDPDDAQPWDIGDATAFNGACYRRAAIMCTFIIAGVAI